MSLLYKFISGSTIILIFSPNPNGTLDFIDYYVIVICTIWKLLVQYVKSEGDPGFELKMSQNLQPLLALLKNSPAISAFLSNEALAVDFCL